MRTAFVILIALAVLVMPLRLGAMQPCHICDDAVEADHRVSTVAADQCCGCDEGGSDHEEPAEAPCGDCPCVFQCCAPRAMPVARPALTPEPFCYSTSGVAVAIWGEGMDSEPYLSGLKRPPRPARCA